MLLALSKAKEHRQHMHVCTVIVRFLNLRHRVSHVRVKRSVKSSLLFAEVTLDDSDSLRWKVKNLDPIDSILFRPSQHDEH